MVKKDKSVKVFGRLKDERGYVVFTCSASGKAFNIASAECVRMANIFIATKPKATSGCGCSKQVHKMLICECCDTRLVKSCNGDNIIII